MGIYIPGMKMPTDRSRWVVINPDGKVEYSDKTDEWETLDKGAVPVPPHGRLGDLDGLEQMFADIDHAPYSCFDGIEPFYSAEDAAQIIRLAPTIIPAEEAQP